MAIVFGASAQNLKVNYDADREEFSIAIPFRRRKMYLLPNAPEMATVETNSEVLSRSKYIGSNAMGAKVEVSSTQSESYGFAVDPRAWFFNEAESRSSSQQVQLGIPAPIGLAVSLKSKIRVALSSSSVLLRIAPFQNGSFFTEFSPCGNAPIGTVALSLATDVNERVPLLDTPASLNQCVSSDVYASSTEFDPWTGAPPSA